MKDMKKNESLAKHTTLQIGGPAELFYIAKNKDDLIEILSYVKERALPTTVIGGGSNLLISDQGVKGLVILNHARAYEFEENKLYCESGAPLMKVASDAVKLGWKMDFAAGIPGTIGGAVVGNAGAHGMEIADILLEAEVWDGKIKIYQKSDFSYGYRTSKLKGKENKYILSAKFGLEPGDEKRMEGVIAADRIRRASLYRGLTCGSYFKNPEGTSAGELIDKSGLKGYRIGGAKISENHANVLVNNGGATAAEVCELEQIIISKVKKETGVTLEPEVVKIGF